MRSNFFSEVGLLTRLGQWWPSVPFVTSWVGIICGLVYLVSRLVGYDSFIEICFLPSAVIERFQVYRVYTAILFHSSLLHLVFNMLALVPLGSVLERITGSVRFLNVMLILAASNALFHLLIVALAAYNPLNPYPHLMNECSIGFSGIIFAMIVIETSLSGIQSRSVFGLINIPAKWYAWILLITFQILMTNVSVIGHLCGILTGFAYIYGMYDFLLLGPSFNSDIESSPLLSACVRRPGFIISSGGNPSSYLPTYSNNASSSSGSGHIWRSIFSSLTERETPADEPSQDRHRFSGRVITPGSTSSPSTSASITSPGLPVRVFDNRITIGQISEGRLSSIESAGVAGDCIHNQLSQDSHRYLTRGKALVSTSMPSTSSNPNPGISTRIFDSRITGEYQISESSGVAGVSAHNQGLSSFDEEIQKLVVMGFEKSQAELALDAADGDSSLAVEILVNE